MDCDYPLRHIVDMQLNTFSNICLCDVSITTDRQSLCKLVLHYMDFKCKLFIVACLELDLLSASFFLFSIKPSSSYGVIF